VRQFDALDVMQADLAESLPDLDIQILGINEWADAFANDLATEGREIPWLQDVDADQNGVSDVRQSWDLAYRDVAILDANNVLVDEYNLTENDLGDPRNGPTSANYLTLRQKLIDAAEGGTLPDSWTNPQITLDVNNDGELSPIDALLVINDLNTFGPRQLPAPSQGSTPPPFLDTSGDGYVTPVDALRVLNHLNEQTVAAVPASADHGEAEANDELAVTALTPEMAVDVAAALAVDQLLQDVSRPGKSLTALAAEDSVERLFA
jgi:hypothetical protein